MHERFEQHLGHLNELAVDVLDPESSEEDLDKFGQEISFTLERQARRRDSDIESQQDIFKLQLVKQEAMQVLHESLRNLDDPEASPYEQGPRAIPVRYADGVFIANGEDGEEEITKGEMFVNGDWGLGIALCARCVRSSFDTEAVYR